MGAVSAVAPHKLDVVRVILGAAVAPVFHKRIILGFALPVIALRLARHFVDSSGGDVALELASLVPMLLLTVACHRIFILGPRSTAGHGPRWWAGRMARFFGWGFVVGFVAGIAAIPAMIFGIATNFSDATTLPFMAYLLAVPALYVFSRLSLVFPVAATVDAPADLGKAWQLSAGNGLRLMLVVGLLPGLLDTLLGYVPALESLLSETVVTLVWLYVLVVQIAALSMSYRELTRIHGTPAADASAAAA
jgi:hypothetical protein